MLYDLSDYLLANYCNLFSYNQLKNDLELNSVANVKKFCGYLSEPYLFFYLPRYSSKVKIQRKSPQKAYVVDNGFIRTRSFELSPNDDRLLENLVFIELLRRNYRPGLELFYYRTRNNKEVDFVCRQGNRVTTLIQVCFDVSSVRTLKRETGSLLEAGSELGCDHLQVLTWDRESEMAEQNHRIDILPAWKWLLGLGGR